MKVFLVFALIGLVLAEDVKEKEDAAQPESNKDKRQTHELILPAHLIYRAPRKQEQTAPVEETHEEEEEDDDKLPSLTERAGVERYRPGQVFSLNAHELLALQPERRAPAPPTGAQLQQLYPAAPARPHPAPPARPPQNVQTIYYLDPQSSLQGSLQPSHTVIARPPSSANGGEASVGAALSVSDTGAPGSTFDDELLALLGESPARQEDLKAQTYSHQHVPTQSVAPQYQQIDRYITKPTKKPTNLRPKIQINPPQAASAPQQYHIETTSVQQKPQQYRYVQHQHPHPQHQQQAQYRAQPSQGQQQPRLRYVPVSLQNHPTQGLKIVAAPKLQQPQPQPQQQHPQQQKLAYRVIPQYREQVPEAKQYRLIDSRPQPRPEQRVPAPSVDRPAYKPYPEAEKPRAIKYVEVPELYGYQKQPQYFNDQYYLRSLYNVYKTPEKKYELTQQQAQSQASPTKPPQSSIYVSKNVAPKKVAPQPQEPAVRVEEEVQYKPKEESSESYSSEGQTMEERRAKLPPPKNNRAYTPEEFNALVAAGYSVTPVPVSQYTSQAAQSRSSIEIVAPPVLTRPYQNRRNQYLPLRSEAP